MAVPDYQTLMRPSLAVLADGQERAIRDVYDRVAELVGILDDDRTVLIPSGKQSQFTNRVAWAITYLAKARLVARPKRGIVRITERGQAALDQHKQRIDNSVLALYPEFVEFKATKHDAPSPSKTLTADPELVTSPDEAIRELVDEVNEAVAAEVLERVLAQSPAFLERLVLQLLQAMGYGGVESVSEHLGGPGDEGLDGVIRQDALGLDVVYVQAKRYAVDRKISRPDIQGFVGALNGARADRGIFITTSSFTNDAHRYVEKVQQRLVLIDGSMLALEMVKRNVGVDVREQYDVKRVDEDFFED